MAMAMTSGALQYLRSTARPLAPAGISRALEHLIEFAFQHSLQEFAGSIPQASFNRIEPVVEKRHRSFDFQLRMVRHRAMACHGVISAGFGRNRFCIKLEITPPSISNHSRYGTTRTLGQQKNVSLTAPHQTLRESQKPTTTVS